MKALWLPGVPQRSFHAVPSTHFILHSPAHTHEEPGPAIIPQKGTCGAQEMAMLAHRTLVFVLLLVLKPWCRVDLTIPVFSFRIKRILTGRKVW